jgi:2-C-methyl-D-erythritol 4-phosphate cytidylyltransferase
MVGAVIVGAGEGTRFGPNGRKQFAKVNGKPLIAYTIEPFEKSEIVDDIVLVVPRESTEWVREEIIEPLGFKKVRSVVPGGQSRQQSVLNGLKALSSETESVIIHDAVRPLVAEPIIKRVVDAARKTGAAITAVPPKDTVKEVESGEVIGTLDRRLIWLAQTPQCFRYDIIMEAHRRALSDNFEATDDAGLVEKYGSKVVVAVGSYANLKVTSPEDIPLLEYFLRESNRMRLDSAASRKGKGGGGPEGGGSRRRRGSGRRSAPQGKGGSRDGGRAQGGGAARDGGRAQGGGASSERGASQDKDRPQGRGRPSRRRRPRGERSRPKRD